MKRYRYSTEHNSRAFYSKAHYERIHGVPDTARTIKSRQDDDKARRLAKIDADEAVPIRSADDLDLWQETFDKRRYYYLKRMGWGDACPADTE